MCAVYEQQVSTDNPQAEKRKAMLLEKPSRINADISSMTAEEKSKRFRQSAIEDILQTVKVRDSVIKERGDVKNTFKREV